MATKGKKTTTKKLLNADAFMVGSVRFILTNRGNIVAVTLLATFVKIHSAIKIPILLLYWDSPAEENGQSEKLHSTLNVSLRLDGARRPCFTAFLTSPSPSTDGPIRKAHL
jgi:hypothetical protein